MTAWRPIEEITPTEIKPGHGGATSGPVLLTNGTDVWAGAVWLHRNIHGNTFVSCDVHGCDGYDCSPEFKGATHYMPMPAPLKEVG